MGVLSDPVGTTEGRQLIRGIIPPARPMSSGLRTLTPGGGEAERHCLSVVLALPSHDRSGPSLQKQAGGFYFADRLKKRKMLYVARHQNVYGRLLHGQHDMGILDVNLCYGALGWHDIMGSRRPPTRHVLQSLAYGQIGPTRQYSQDASQSDRHCVIKQGT